MKKSYLIGGFVVFIAVVGLVVWSAKNNESQSLEPGGVAAPMPAPGEGNNVPEMIVVPESAAVVSFTSDGYVPNSVSVRKGETVTFRNDSQTDVWPASAKHPTHEVYPEVGGCIGSKFDACRGIPPGESWSFRFDQVGSWKYHDHLNPSFTGTITVK